MRVRLSSRPSWSISFRARSTAAASDDPSLGTWLRRSGAAVVRPLERGGFAGSPLVMVMALEVLRGGRSGRVVRGGKRKTLAIRRGSVGNRSVVELAALAPP